MSGFERSLFSNRLSQAMSSRGRLPQISIATDARDALCDGEERFKTSVGIGQIKTTVRVKKGEPKEGLLATICRVFKPEPGGGPNLARRKEG